jgi:hybrid cluster-associated redox disulfide protein
MITKDMKIAELLNKYPEAIGVLQENGVGCVGCMLAQAETIGQGLSAHGLDTDALIAKMNESIAKKPVANKKKK